MNFSKASAGMTSSVKKIGHLGYLRARWSISAKARAGSFWR